SPDGVVPSEQGLAPDELRARRPFERAHRGHPAGPKLTARHNLPPRLTSFVGREAALAEAMRLLEDNRLLTLVGSGGIGKTRLALRIASDLVDVNPDGAWLVELAP